MADARHELVLWEEKLKRLNTDAKKAMSDQIKRSVVLNMMPRAERISIERAATPTHLNDYLSMRAELIRLADIESLNEKPKNSRKGPDDMDVDRLEEGNWDEHSWTDWPYPQESQDTVGGDLNAFGKGYGKDKGKGKGAYNPFTYNSSYYKGNKGGGKKGDKGSKGGGKGSDGGKGGNQPMGMFQGYCGLCWEWGHTKKYCKWNTGSPNGTQPRQANELAEESNKTPERPLETLDLCCFTCEDEWTKVESKRKRRNGKGTVLFCNAFNSQPYAKSESYIDIESNSSTNTVKNITVKSETYINANTVKNNTVESEPYIKIEAYSDANILKHVTFADVIRKSDNKVDCIDRDILEFTRDEGKVTDVVNGEGWIKLTMTADSGASDTVFPTSWFPEFKAQESPESRSGVTYRAANGQALPNRGCKDLQVFTSDGAACKMRVQLADIAKPLFSLGRSTAKGHRVVLDEASSSYLEHKASGRRTPLRKENGVFLLDVWVKVKEPLGFARPGTQD